MSTQEHDEMWGEPWTPARDVQCPGCGLSTLLRSDTGRCERCTAVMPESVDAWQRWKRRCQEVAEERRRPMAPNTCMVCNQAWNASTQKLHDERCPAKPYACECGRRFWDTNARATHQRSKVCMAREFRMPERSPL